MADLILEMDAADQASGSATLTREVSRNREPIPFLKLNKSSFLLSRALTQIYFVLQPNYMALRDVMDSAGVLPTNDLFKIPTFVSSVEIRIRCTEASEMSNKHFF